jgi:hypothetical protein
LAFRIPRETISFGRAGAAVKAWILRWASTPPRYSGERHPGEIDPRSCLGAYGLLVGLNRHETRLRFITANPGRLEVRAIHAAVP